MKIVNIGGFDLRTMSDDGISYNVTGAKFFGEKLATILDAMDGAENIIVLFTPNSDPLNSDMAQHPAL